MHPLLPPEWVSRAVRIAMSADDWARFDALAAEAGSIAPTQARAQGEVIARLLRESPDVATRSTHWLDWERQKTLRLLRPTN